MSAGTILERIAAATAERIAVAKRSEPLEALQARAAARPKPRDFVGALRRPQTLNVIAEIKLASPSEGIIGGSLDPIGVARDYAANGAAAISVLTEPAFFYGRLDNLSRIRTEVPNAPPLLMKEFVLDEYQLWQALAYGADAVLLIVKLLRFSELERLFRVAAELNLPALVETHDEDEFAAARRLGATLIGVNSRDLATLKTDLNTARRLAVHAADPTLTLVAESGLTTRADLLEFSRLGYRAFLIGTHLIKTGRPGAALAELVRGGD